MRIISGMAGGRRIRAPDTPGTRPATDRVREAVFSSLGSRVEEADVADLYAGSGSFGLEALSRGARSATFVESSRRALSALRANIAAIGLGGEVTGGRVDDFLEGHQGQFDLVFLDPPWDLETSTVETQFALLDRLIRPGGTVVVSRRHTDSKPRAPKNWRLAADKRYGDTRILRYEKAKPEDYGEPL